VAALCGHFNFGDTFGDTLNVSLISHLMKYLFIPPREGVGDGPIGGGCPGVSKPIACNAPAIFRCVCMLWV